MMLFGPWGGLVAIALLVSTYIVLSVAFWRFLKKAGLTPMVALLMLVPVVNAGVALWAAFTEWPVEREVERLKLALASAESIGATPAAGAQNPRTVPGTTAVG